MLRSTTYQLMRSIASARAPINLRLSSTLAPAEHLSTGVAEDKPIKEVVPVDAVTGAPESLHRRIVRIYRPSKTAMQSGVQGTKGWRMDWDTLEGDNRWTNPLMGWASSGDFMQGTKLSFASQDDAIRFAEKNGWDYFVQAPHMQEFHPKSYSSNFTRTQMNPRKIAHTK
ncbi:ndufs4 NADH dehydrogenase Fe-S protein subunit [Savitreella phatthalungensis]